MIYRDPAPAVEFGGGRTRSKSLGWNYWRAGSVDEWVRDKNLNQHWLYQKVIFALNHAENQVWALFFMCDTHDIVTWLPVYIDIACVSPIVRWKSRV